LPEDVRTRLASAADGLRDELVGEDYRPVRAENLHLTLRFLGTSPSEKLERLSQGAVEAAARWSAFRLSVEGAGCFPNARRPRVVWVGVKEGMDDLRPVAEDLESLARTCGYDAEDRPFSAHLTIGRIRSALTADGARKLEAWTRVHQAEAFGSVPVEAIVLYQSDLRPAGPVYRSLQRFPLGAGAG
jgi:2'-5' RNA ligase